MNSRRLEHVIAVCLFAALLLSFACAKPGQNSPNQTPAPGASPAASREPATVTGESGNWKVTVQTVVKHPKPPPSTPIVPELENRQTIVGSDLDQITIHLVIEYLGAPGNVAAPPAAVLDANGRRFEIINVGAEAPALKGSNKYDEAEMNKLAEVPIWLFSVVPRPGKKPNVKSRSLSTREQFTVNYNFEDPKGENLKLVFADVPRITLPPAKEPEPSK